MCTLEHKALSTFLGLVQSDSTLLRTQACRDNGERKQVATEWLPGAGLFCALPAHTSLFSVLVVSSNPSSKAA